MGSGFWNQGEGIDGTRGRKCKAMHGRACEGRNRGRHMWTGPNRCNSVVAGDVSSPSSSLSPANSFCKVLFFFSFSFPLNFLTQFSRYFGLCFASVNEGISGGVDGVDFGLYEPVADMICF